VGELAGEQQQLGPVGVLGRERLDPRRDRVRRRAHERWTEPRDRACRGRPVFGGQVVVDGLDRTLEPVQRFRDLPRRSLLVCRRRFPREAGAEEVAEQRVQLVSPARRRGAGAHEQGVAVDCGCKPLLRAEARAFGHVQVGGDACGEQRAAKLGIEWCEDLLVEVGVGHSGRGTGGGGVGPGCGERDAEGPSVGCV
jgi:hypothetical protein